MVRLAVALSLATLLPAAGGAEELLLGIGAEVGYDSNLFGRGQNDGGDVRLGVDPSIQLRDPDGHLQWAFGYRPSYEYFVDAGEDSGFNHFVDGAASWDVTRRTRISAEGSYAKVQTLGAFIDEQDIATGEVFLESGFRTSSFKTYNVNAALTHRLSRLQQASLSARFFGTDRQDGSDTEGWSVTASWVRSISARTQLGINASASRQELTGSRLDASRGTDFYNVSGYLRHFFDPTLELTLSVGPSLVEDDDVSGDIPESFVVPLFPLVSGSDGAPSPIDAATCPTQDGRSFLAPGCRPLDADLTPQQVALLQGLQVSVPSEEGLGRGGSDGTTYFADASLRKRWEHVASSLFYRRTTTAQATEQLGSSSVADILGANLDWQIADRWSLLALLSWTRQERATDVTAPTVVVGSLAQDALFVPAGSAFSTAVAPFDVDSDFEIVQTQLSATLRYRWKRRTTIFLRGNYLQEDQNVDGETILDRDQWRVSVGFTHFFDPIRF